MVTKEGSKTKMTYKEDIAANDKVPDIDFNYRNQNCVSQPILGER